MILMNRRAATTSPEKCQDEMKIFIHELVSSNEIPELKGLDFDVVSLLANSGNRIADIYKGVSMYAIAYNDVGLYAIKVIPNPYLQKITKDIDPEVDEDYDFYNDDGNYFHIKRNDIFRVELLDSKIMFHLGSGEVVTLKYKKSDLFGASNEIALDKFKNYLKDLL